MSEKAMVERRTWEEFRQAGLLWWVNRGLHLFGWVIVFDVEDDATVVTEVYPARVPYRGFSRGDEEWGFKALTLHIGKNVHELIKETGAEEWRRRNGSKLPD